MKELFNNSKGYNTVEINLNCRAGDISLHYQLSDNPVQHIWQEIHLVTNQYVTGVPMNTPVHKVLKQTDSICEALDIKKIPKNFSQEDLNYAHNVMVELANKKADPNIALLNKLIHVLEGSLNNKYSEYSASVIFYSANNEKYVPIKEEYKLWLEPNLKWGDLFLGYGTLGKDWVDIYIDNDNLDDLVVQNTISSETCLSFRTDYNFPKATETLFYRWANNKFDIPLTDLNKLSLGRYLLGKLIIDETFLAHHKNVGDWYIPNHICKLTWNRDVIGSDVKINSVRFYNDNKYQEMSIDHAQIRPIL